MRRSVKYGLIVGAVVVVVAAAVTGGLLAWRSAFTSGVECTVPGRTLDGTIYSGATAVPVTAAGGATTPPAGTVADAPEVELTVAQLHHASTINAVGLQRGIPERGRIIAVATAYQESSLRNRDDGDRDSVGLFQQRPSQGWGTKEQIQDPVYASGKFYDALLQVDDWPALPLTQAAQAVQQSGHPDAYAKWEPQATTLVRNLSGAAPVELTCDAGSLRPTALAPGRPALPGTDDATPQLSAALAAAEAELGGITVREVSSEGLTATVDVTVPDLPADQAGRALAAWAVAHGIGMNITDVSVDGQRWTDHEWGAADEPLPGGRVQLTVAP